MYVRSLFVWRAKNPDRFMAGTAITGCPLTGVLKMELYLAGTAALEHDQLASRTVSARTDTSASCSSMECCD